jgi:hypothetical protein
VLVAGATAVMLYVKDKPRWALSLQWLENVSRVKIICTDFYYLGIFLGDSSTLRLEYNKKCNILSLSTVALNKQTQTATSFG